MKNQVLSIDQMQHLKELGVDTSKASMKLVSNMQSSDCEYDDNDNPKNFHYVAVEQSFYSKQYNEKGNVFTLQDIISMLPDSIDNNILTIRKCANGVSVSYENLYTRSILSISQEDSLIKSSYEMLVWCLSYGIIKTNNKTE